MRDARRFCDEGIVDTMSRSEIAVQRSRQVAIRRLAAKVCEKCGLSPHFSIFRKAGGRNSRPERSVSIDRHHARVQLLMIVVRVAVDLGHRPEVLICYDQVDPV